MTDQYPADDAGRPSASGVPEDMGVAGPPWRRYVALGDSITEGLADEDPARPGQYCGWADRLAHHLDAALPPGERLRYANLAIRGRLIGEIADQQVPVALDLVPDLVTLMGGTNDLLRPGADLDRIATRLEQAVQLLRGAGIEVLLATQPDPVLVPITSRLRGRHAVLSAHVRTIADRHGCRVVDLWGVHELRSPLAWDADRLHLSSYGHHLASVAAAEALGVSPSTQPGGIWRDAPAAEPAWRPDGLRRQNVAWVGEVLIPWIGRRLTGRSSGATLSPKRSALEPVERP